ncbi:hypothetical protein K491DRAFT_695564 [Lophiostoma macrostomum CBS 122681]|uniref:Uncharacterized protein n=1 Tax=Lophiostoma macrostomum CBS 122681 TaxID=1314788 RepID=A0A6A6T1T3_9PLEO|nr:hypothetical protein K491DRAFT_695564 [Lophiostoma macrostomum CBS 122681]
MATTRLRRTFQYPADSDDEDAVEEGMDEIDQETLITTLSTRDTSTTNLYTRILLTLPLAPILLYIPRLFSLQTLVPSALAAASLASSAYTLWFLPLPASSVPTTTTTSSSNNNNSSNSRTRNPRNPQANTISPSQSLFAAPASSARPIPYIPPATADAIRAYIIPTNIILCIAMAVVELWARRPWSEGVTVGGGYLPGLVLGVVVWARRELRVVDLGELERLRYRSQ